MDLYIIRHGEVSKKLLYSNNPNSSLTYFGITEVQTIANVIKNLKLNVDLILTSPITSSLETAKIIRDYINKRIKVMICEDLKPEGNILNAYKKIIEYSKGMSSILIVGHEPYLSNMISDIISKNNGKNSNNLNVNNKIVLKKYGLSKIRITSTVPKLKGELRWLLTSRVLKKLI